MYTATLVSCRVVGVVGGGGRMDSEGRVIANILVASSLPLL